MMLMLVAYVHTSGSTKRYARSSARSYTSPWICIESLEPDSNACRRSRTFFICAKTFNRTNCRSRSHSPTRSRS